MDIIQEIQENREDIKRYIKQIIAMELEIKAIKEDMKELKKEAKENGILVKEINAAINQIKKELKKKPDEKNIEEKIIELIEEDEDLFNSIQNIVN